MCLFRGTTGTQALLAGKSTHHVDGIGQYTGMNIVTANTRKLKRATEMEAWIAVQKSALRMLRYYETKAEEGDEKCKDRIETTRTVIEAYSEYTHSNPLADEQSAPADSPEPAPPAPPDLDSEAAAAASEARERERVALPMQMEAFSKMVVLSDAQYQLYKKDFDAVDKDGSGRVDKGEVAALLAAQLGSEPRPEQVQGFVDKFDKNKDGLISLEEWIGAVVGKDYAVSSGALGEAGGGEKGSPEFLDREGSPLAMGLIYVFAGGG